MPSSPRLLGAEEVRRLATRPVDLGVAAVAAVQGGPVALWQLRVLGLTRDMVLERKRSGRLHSPFRGVYLPGHHRWDAAAQMIGAMLAVGDSWPCAGTSAWLWGMLPAPPPVPHLLVIGDGRSRRAGMALHQVARIDPIDVTVLRGVPVVTPVRTMLELAERASARAVAEALGSGEVRKLLTRAELAKAMERWPGRRGLKPLREELAGDLEPRPTRSENERRFRRLWSRVRIWPSYTPNGWVLDKERDVVWEDLRVVVELDGDVHFTERAAQADRRRDSALAAAGYTTLRFSGERLRDDPTGVAAEVSAVLAIAGRRTGGVGAPT